MVLNQIINSDARRARKSHQQKLSDSRFHCFDKSVRDLRQILVTVRTSACETRMKSWARESLSKTNKITDPGKQNAELERKLDLIPLRDRHGIAKAVKSAWSTRGTLAPAGVENSVLSSGSDHWSAVPGISSLAWLTGQIWSGLV